LDLPGVFFFGFDGLSAERVDELIFAFDLVIFVINYALEGADGLLCCLVEFESLIFVVLFLVFLVADEPAGVVAELAGGEFGLHHEVCG
jgi:uncharacterized membrane protein YtjA (UPF0391 family)